MAAEVPMFLMWDTCNISSGLKFLILTIRNNSATSMYKAIKNDNAVSVKNRKLVTLK